ncbi:MFS transporter [Actinopolyspora mortivallis]|uniref:MFS transporter n=1 Tax=Actinopolyspora mortivallis TaxID=33906 RepID=A0A2T0H0Y4_ACTMO|nr:MFS transporter [Actinopolyspora mortivallis]
MTWIRTSSSGRRTSVSESEELLPNTATSTAEPPVTSEERQVLWRGALALAAAMGVGRFAYTPILPLMERQAGLGADTGAQIATANYVGYLVGALLLSFRSSLAVSRAFTRGWFVVLVGTTALMPLTTSPPVWMLLRLLTGVASAVIFIVSAQAVLRTLRSNPHLSGWAYGGVGLGIAVSGTTVLLLGTTASWSTSWWLCAALALLLGFPVWTLLDRAASPRERTARDGTGREGRGRAFGLLLTGYFLEGVGYIIAATFLVAALSDAELAWLGNGAWVLVGLAAVPSCVLWARFSRGIAAPSLLVAALLLQAVAVALPGLTSAPTLVAVSAVAFGGTFMGITTLALASGAQLGVPGSAAALTAAYGLGQIVGPLVVQPTLGAGYQPALLIGGAVLLAGAVTMLLLRLTAWPGVTSSHTADRESRNNTS